jgi:glutamate racemase
MDARPIGVFDSGVGGLTVVKGIRGALPNESIVYVGDTARVPYGTRSRETIITFALEIVRKLLDHDVKALVVACNTISAVALDEIRALTNLPVLGVIEPTVKEAVNQSKNKVIGVIGTQATIQSKAYEMAIQAIEPHAQVIALATPMLVPIVEEELFNDPVADVMVKEYLGQFEQVKQLDTLILGCTHYPLLKDKIEACMGTSVRVIDSAYPTANTLRELLTDKDMLGNGGKPTQVFFTSDDPSKSEKIAKDFLGEEVHLDKIRL